MSAIHLPLIWQDHMMIQRDKPIKITVAAPAGSRIHVRLRQDSDVIFESEEDFLCGGRPDAQTKRTVPGCLDEDGVAGFTLPAAGAGFGYELELSSGDEVLTIHDICAGDIWMAMGQSNMEYFLRYDADWNYTLRDVRMAGPDPYLRMYNCPQVAYDGQKISAPSNGVWFAEGDDPWWDFSAPGYYFAKYVLRKLREDRKLKGAKDAASGLVPIGVVGCNWGGTSAQVWMREEYLKDAPLSTLMDNYAKQVLMECGLYHAGTANQPSVAPVYVPETKKHTAPHFELPDDATIREKLEQKSMDAWASECSYEHGVMWRAMMEGMTIKEQLEWIRQHVDAPVIPMGPWHHYRPCSLVHTMVETIAPFPARGILWYQGESNSGEDAKIYAKTMEAMVRNFREIWELSAEELPFYHVQIAPFGQWLGCLNDGYAIVRDQQAEASRLMPNSAHTNVMDLGDRDDIHPKFKKEVGRRLARLAFRDGIYGSGAGAGRSEQTHPADLSQSAAVSMADSPRAAHSCAPDTACAGSSTQTARRIICHERIAVEGGVRFTVSFPDCSTLTCEDIRKTGIFAYTRADQHEADKIFSAQSPAAGPDAESESASMASMASAEKPMKLTIDAGGNTMLVKPPQGRNVQDELDALWFYSGSKPPVAWDLLTLSKITENYFREKTGFDYRHPLGVTDIRLEGGRISFTVRTNTPDDPVLISVGELDWCMVLLKDGSGVPVGPCHEIL